MGSNDPTSPPSEDTDVHVEGDVSGQVAIGEHITQVGDIHGGEVTIGQRITNFFLGSTEQQRAQRNRQAMLQLVKNTWIKGVLEQSLHGAAMIELGMEERVDAVERPWDMVVQVPNQPIRVLPAGTRVVNVFEDMNCALLILGEPGSGKTTTLLELARDTITRAENDPTQPIPVVFNLSSWAEKRRPIAEWLVEELNTKYHIPKRIARPWVENDDLLLLLDGLDEVKREHREACVEAINSFRRDHGLAPLVVCSRVADYEALTMRLQLRGAVKLQPLSLGQVERYLTEMGVELAATRDMLRGDPTLQELVKTPLMLSVMMLVYQEDATEGLGAQEVPEASRKHLFDAYVRRMFERRATKQRYTPQQTVAWLARLAQGMVAHGQTIFQMEELQPSWLAKGVQRWEYLLSSRVVGTLMILGPFGLFMDSLSFWGYLLLLGTGIGLVDGMRRTPRRESRERGRETGFWRAAANLVGISLLAVILLLGWAWVDTQGAGDDFAVNWGNFLFSYILFGLPVGLHFGLRGARRRLEWEVQTVEGLIWSWRSFLIPFLAVSVLLGGANLGYSLMIRERFGGKVQICDVSGKSQAELNTTTSVRRVVFSPDGTQLATVHWDGTIRLWSADGEELPGSESVRDGTQVAFSSDGTHIATVHKDGIIRLWNTDGEELPGWESIRDGTQVAFSPDGTRIATVHEGGIIRLWNTDGEELPGLESVRDGIRVAFSPDGTHIATVHTDGTIWLWNTDGEEPVKLKSLGNVRQIAFSPDGTRIATVYWDRGIRLWNTDGEELVRLGDAGNARQVAFSPDGTRITTVHGDDIIRLWDTGGEEAIELVRLEGAGNVEQVAFGPGRAHATAWHLGEPSFWTGGNAYHEVTLWDVERGAIIAYWLNRWSVFSPDGSYLLLLPYSSQDWIWLVPLWIVLGLFLGIILGLRHRLADAKTSPNQGIRLSLRNASFVSLIIVMVVGASLQLLSNLMEPSDLDLGSSPGIQKFLAAVAEWPFWLATALLSSISVGLGYGGLDVIQHYILRLILRITGQAPWRYAHFLDYATERVFLRRVGGGYIFVHRLVQEHFASLYEGGKAAS